MRIMADGCESFPPSTSRIDWLLLLMTIVATVNNIRAMRVAEIMNDFRTIQTQLAAIRTQTSAEEYNEDGYVILRQCVGQAQQLLQQPFRGGNGGNGTRDEEGTKKELRW